MTITITLARNPAYEDDDSEPLITKATWPLKVSGLLFAGMLVLGRSASYGNITWTPAHHAATSPLVVVHQTDGSSPPPALPKSARLSDLGALSKRTAADEVVTFSPGSNSSDDGEKEKREEPKGDAKDPKNDRDHDHDARGVSGQPAGQEAKNDRDRDHDEHHLLGQGTAQTAKETAKETPGEATGQETATVATATNAETAATTQADTKAETAGEVSGQATASANAANGNNNRHDNGQVNNEANGLDAANQAAWLGRAEETPWVAVGAVGGLMTLIGLAFLKPWRFLRRFIR